MEPNSEILHLIIIENGNDNSESGFIPAKSKGEIDRIEERNKEQKIK